MAQCFPEITPKLTEWIRSQHVFFVATAPLSADGLVNCSPKGMDTLRILGPREVAYLDLTGSGIETVAHLRENGRIVIMLCAFDGPPRIVRLHGAAQVLLPGEPAYEELTSHFPSHVGARCIVRSQLRRISDSCGYAVPRMDYVEDREVLTRWAETKGPDGIERYQRDHNAKSLDGLPALERS